MFKTSLGVLHDPSQEDSHSTHVPENPSSKDVGCRASCPAAQAKPQTQGDLIRTVPLPFRDLQAEGRSKTLIWNAPNPARSVVAAQQFSWSVLAGFWNSAPPPFISWSHDKYPKRCKPSVITSKAANGYHFKTGQQKWPSRTEIVLPCRLLWWQVGFGAPAPRATLEHVSVVQ